jgi:hypothetical protein
VTDEEKKREKARVVAAYQDLFDDPEKRGSVGIVMADLSGVCHMQESGWHPDPSYMYHLTGRREVFIHITNMTNLTPDLIERMVVAEAQLTEPQERDYDPLGRGA